MHSPVGIFAVLRGWPQYGGDIMTEKENPDDDWMQYSNAGFGKTDYSLWEDVVEHKPEEEVEEFDDSPDLEGEIWDDSEQLGSHMDEIPRAPNPAGHKHMVRSGVCDSCLGRCGGKKMFDQSNAESGAQIRAEVLQGDSHLSDSGNKDQLCPYCENLFDEVDLLTELILEAMEGYEATKIQIGARIPKDQIETEDNLRKKYAAGGSEALKPALVNEISKKIRESGKGYKTVSDSPEILAIVDVLTLSIELDIRAVYYYGRYQKLERGIPQTRWPCRACKGRGCEKCNFTGQQYDSSVQDLIGSPMCEFLDAQEDSFHGMGREDIDVRCMGSGRPFVIEIKEPKTRTVDTEVAMAEINSRAEGKIKINSLRLSNRKEVVRIKDTPAEKSYAIRFKLHPMTENEYNILTAPMDLTQEDIQERGSKGRKRQPRQKRGDKGQDATKPLQPEIEKQEWHSLEGLEGMKKAELMEIIEERGLTKTGTKAVLIQRILDAGPPELPTVDRVSNEEILQIIENLAGVKLAQRTPDRVSHRRADLVRRRTVYETNNPIIEEIDGDTFVEFTLRCESGTYVKETVHGDSGRTQPSVAALIKSRCEVMWLDVADIHAD